MDKAIKKVFYYNLRFEKDLKEYEEVINCNYEVLNHTTWNNDKGDFFVCLVVEQPVKKSED